jgi:hypothetical protein
VLSLQAHAGNAAVATAIQALGARPAAPAVQRKPKPKKVPQWVTDAQATMAQLFPNDKLLSQVVIKDFADLNRTLRGGGFAAWTQSETAIYIRDPTRFVDKANPASTAWPPMIIRYVLQHEAVHVRQFKRDGQPPGTWQRMLEYEEEAYTTDLAWLAQNPTAKLISDPKLLAALRADATKNLGDVQTLLKDTATLTGKKREARLFKRMKDLDLIPRAAKADPRLLYKQP